jgi:predicted TIM-barrel fold metal-dependent hydrolase
MAAAATAADERYTIISADCHAGGSHAAYREYLDPAYLEDFDAWRGKYKNPYKDLGDTRRLRNWDNEMRNGQQEADGIVGEVVFPNTVPPFFPSFVLFAKPPTDDEYPHRHAGVQAHNRWLVDWCNEFPERRAGVGQIFLNDIDDTIADIHWIKDHGLRGGLLLPNIAPDVKWVKPLYDPEYDRVWEVCQDLEIPVNVHSGTGNPDYGPYPTSMLLYINEVTFYSQRPLVQMILSGVFERFPRLKVVLTEAGCAWVPPLLERLDWALESIRSTGATGEIRYGAEHILPRSATDYFRQNVWMGVSQPGPEDVAAREKIGLDRFMWGSDYPHDEGTHPYTREHLRSRFSDVDPGQLKMFLSENAAQLYDFDLQALAPLAAKFGPTVGEIAEPIDAIPDKTLDRLSGDMDPQAIK